MAETDRWSPPEGTSMSVIGASRWLAARGFTADRRTIKRWIDRGYLPAYTVAGRQYIHVADLEKLLENTPWEKDD